MEMSLEKQKLLEFQQQLAASQRRVIAPPPEEKVESPRIRKQKESAARYKLNGYEVDESGHPIHRRVCRAVNGRFPSNWVVHHVDGDKQNNKSGNLIAIPEQFHSWIHGNFPLCNLPRREQLYEMFYRFVARCDEFRSIPRSKSKRSKKNQKKRKQKVARGNNWRK